MNTLRTSLVLGLALIAPVVLAQAVSPSSSRPASSNVIQTEAWQLVTLANHSRAQSGLAPLQWDAALATAARQHCLRMAAEGPISHQYAGEPELSERAGQAGARFSLIEENVAIGPDPATIHNAWMRSPGHRTNLLSPKVDRVGVAVVAGRHGLYAVADYERVVAALTQAQVEATVADLVSSLSHGVAVLPDATAARATCATDAGMPRSSTGAKPRFAMRWQDADLTHLPQDLATELASGRYRQAVVGSCPAHDQDGTFTAYRVAVLLYK